MVTVGTGPFFCRSIPSGGLAVTVSISKDIHATLEDSEQLKITRGSVGLGPGFEPPSDPVEANLAKITRQSLIKSPGRYRQVARLLPHESWRRRSRIDPPERRHGLDALSGGIHP